MKSYRIFIVEDDLVIANIVRDHLERWEYSVSCAESFDQVLAEFAKFDPQLVLMDISLPFFNGYHWCGEIRKISKVPIVFLSSAADHMNQIMAMNMGGDDFIAKPFELSLLTAKIQAILRRAYDFGPSVRVIECGGAVMNLSEGTLYVHGSSVELTKNEWRILQMLLENRGKVVSRSALMTRLWESDDFIDENTLTVNITRLRKKLETAGVHELIHTKKGEGYWAEEQA